MKSLHLHLLALIVFTAITFCLTYPLSLNPSGYKTNGGEESFLSYILNWNIFALTHNQSIFHPPIFHPMKNSLAYSDYLLPNSLIALPFVLITKKPFIAIGINILLAFILNAWFTYLLLYSYTKNFLPSLLGGALFAFSSGRFDTVGHIQVLSMYWLPLGLLFLHRFRRHPSIANAFFIALCFLLQITNTVFLGYVYAFTVSITLLIYLIRRQIFIKSLLPLLLSSIPIMIILTVLFSPYLKVSQDYAYSRNLKDAWGGSTYFLEYLYPTGTSRLQPLAQSIITKHPWPSYMGFTVSLIGGLSLIWIIYQISISKTRNFLSTPLIASASFSLIGFLMSLGPYLQIQKHTHFPLFPLPLPYLLFFHIIPGFKSMRVPQRWSHLFLFGLSLLSGLFLSRLFSRYKTTRIPTLITILLILFTILEVKPDFNTRVTSLSQIPPVYHWVSTQTPGVVLEIPAQTWDMPLGRIEIERMHYHSFFFPARHRFVNGFSGFAPLDWIAQIFAFKQLGIDQRSYQSLIDQSLGINYLIIHSPEQNQLALKDQDTASASALLEYLDKQSELQKIYQDPQTNAYLISSHTSDMQVNTYINFFKHALREAYEQQGIY